MLGGLSVHDDEVLIPMWALVHPQTRADWAKLRLRPAWREVRMMRGVQQVRMSDDW